MLVLLRLTVQNFVNTQSVYLIFIKSVFGFSHVAQLFRRILEYAASALLPGDLMFVDR